MLFEAGVSLGTRRAGLCVRIRRPAKAAHPWEEAELFGSAVVRFLRRTQRVSEEGSVFSNNRHFFKYKMEGIHITSSSSTSPN